MNNNPHPSIEFSLEMMAEVERIKGQFPEGKQKSALLRVLHLAQEEAGGWLNIPVMNQVAKMLGIQPIEVYEVATFYTMYNLEPVGKYVLEVCHTGPCAIEGAERIIGYLEQKLGIGVGHTTPDGMFSLKTVECMGACGYAPMMQVGEFYHEKLSEEKIDRFIEDCKAGKVNVGSWKIDKLAIN
ncbi:MAG: NAD(P)H-dependent oxidoreductase subunit E [Saprospiraceae bacterium]|nr:NAD(P)H-dependent oxidoreductase subunit E [Saprospiraceae bacterium]